MTPISPVVFCDTGAFTPLVQRLQRAGAITAVQGLYENRATKAGIAKPSMWSFDNPNITFDMEVVSFGDAYSSKYDDIVRIIKSTADTSRDALQLDSAYISTAAAFVTSDKRDIVSRRDQREPLLGIRIFHLPFEEDEFCEWVSSIASR